MSDENECPNCSAILRKQHCEECGWPNLFNEPDMPYIEGSEVAGSVEMDAIGTDNIRRPFVFHHEDGSVICLTLDDASRLLKFLNLAVPYLEQQMGMWKQ